MGFGERLHRADNALPWRSKYSDLNQYRIEAQMGNLITPVQRTHRGVSCLQVFSSLERRLLQHGGAPKKPSAAIGRPHIMLAYRKPVGDI